MIKTHKQEEGLYAFDHETGKRLGQAQREEDGYFYFYFSPSGGAWAAHTLQEIADELDKLNKDWNDHINQYFSDKGITENSKSVDYDFDTGEEQT